MRTKTALALVGTVWMLALASCGATNGTTLPEAPIPGGSSASVSANIPGGTWHLVSLRENGQAEVSIADPGTFTAVFGDDGRVQIKADCNRCVAGYTARSNGSLTVGLMACTRAFCTATTPTDTTFANLVAGAQAWSSPDDAHLELVAGTGVLRFQR
jgi:heat shock protein HslJ